MAQGKTPSGDNRHPYDGPGELAAALDEFDERMMMSPLAYDERRTRLDLESLLESIISGAALMADSSCTRDERRERIVAECNAVRQALQDLLSEYMNNVSSRAVDLFRCWVFGGLGLDGLVGFKAGSGLSGGGVGRFIGRFELFIIYGSNDLTNLT